MSRHWRWILLAAVAAAVALLVLLWRGGEEPAATRSTDVQAPRTTPVQTYRDRASKNDPSATITGVVENAHGQPIQGARVCAFVMADDWLATGRAPVCASTKAKGGYSLRQLRAGLYRVTATTEDYFPAAYSGAGADGLLPLGPAEQREDVDITLRERGGATVAGSVRDGLGGVIQGAQVFVSSGPSVVTTTSDGDGRFAARTAPGAVTLAADAHGYAPRVVETIAPSTDLTVELTPQSVLVGRVFGPDDAPVAGARVQASHSDAPNDLARSAVTDADGRFRIEGLLPGRYRPSSRHRGLYGVSERSVSLAIGETSEEIRIHMQPGATVVGRVTAAGGAPCAGAHVLLADPGAQRRYSALTDEAGTVVFEGVVPGRYQVTVLCDGFRSAAPHEPIEVDVEDETTHQWKVDRGRTLAGTVQTRDGVPVPAAMVGAIALTGPRAEQTVASTGTDDQGRFRITGLAPGTYLVAVEARGHAPPDEPLEVELQEGQDREDLRIELSSGVTLAGTVRHPDGSPADNLRVNVTDELGRVNAAAVEADGDFSLGPVGQTAVALELRNARGITVPARLKGDAEPADVLHLEVDDDTSPLQIVASPADRRIQGRMVTGGGQGVADAWVAYERQDEVAGGNPTGDPSALRVMTAGDGSFLLEGLTPGRYTLHALRPGGGEAIAHDVATGTNVELTIIPARTVAGRVEVAGGGPPPAEFRVELRSRAHTLSEPFVATGGSWQIDGVHPGRYDLSVYSSLGSATREITVPEDRDRTGIVLSISTGRIEGRVIDAASDQPIRGCRVLARSASGGSWVGSDLSAEDNITDQSGTFELSGVPGGDLQLWISGEADQCADYGSTLAPAQAEPGRTTSVGDLRIAPTESDVGEPGTLGFRASLDPDFVLRVTEVVPSGPADEAGLSVGDRILAIGDHDLRATRTYRPGLLRVPAGTVVALTLESGNTIEIVAEARAS